MFFSNHVQVIPHCTSEDQQPGADEFRACGWFGGLLKLGELPKYLKSTLLPKTDIEPENTPLEKEKHLQSNQFVWWKKSS